MDRKYQNINITIFIETHEYFWNILTILWLYIFFSKIRDGNHLRQPITDGCAKVDGQALFKPCSLQFYIACCAIQFTYNAVTYIHSFYGYHVNIGSPGLVQWSHNAISDPSSFSLFVSSSLVDDFQCQTLLRISIWPLEHQLSHLGYR